MTESKGLKGIVADHITGKQKEINLNYRIDIKSDGYKEFIILSPVPGIESFSIYNCYISFDDIIENGWDVCDGTDHLNDIIDKYDKLFVPSCEIKKVFERENFHYVE